MFEPPVNTSRAIVISKTGGLLAVWRALLYVVRNYPILCFRNFRATVVPLRNYPKTH